VLVTLSRALAPLLPLVTEEIHTGLTGADSVHLQDWPDVSSWPEERELVAAMDRVRDVCSAGLALRKANDLRGRLPLRQLVVAGAGIDGVRGFADLVRDELNVKDVVFHDGGIERFATFQLAINARVVGPKLGADMKTVMGASRSGQWRMLEPDAEGRPRVEVGGRELVGDEFDLRLQSKEGVASQALPGNEAIVVLDTEVTPELEAEGLVRETFATLRTDGRVGGASRSAELPVMIPGAAERHWRRALSRGVLPDTAYRTVTPEPTASRWKVPAATTTDAASLELSFFDDGKLDGGRLANNAWLQELPESRTKLVWDNALLLGPATAKALELAHEDVVALEHDGARIELPVYILPGQAAGTGAVALGYGRRRAGYVGGDVDEGTRVGVDVAPLRRSNSPWLLTNVRVTKTGRRYALATTQDHWAIDELGKKERERRSHHLVREVSREDYRSDPGLVRDLDHHPPLKSLWTKEQRDGHQWGMSIDLSKCVGCNACVTACQSENNIPVVGKEEVLNGREMHWIRIDRYFQGEAEAPSVAQQPLACAHCESAPCEQVCPVAATMHGHEGTNDMVYNRCIGTRYCANNCPYKVRRFNFLDYHEDLDRGGEGNERIRLMVHNPDVTVRHRGVMEKCTYCTQRIKGAKHDARIAGRRLRDGDITPACAQACPTEAIVFGDLNDDTSRVSRAQADARSYALLAELNIAPRTRYLARITNPNPALSSVAGRTEEGS